MKKRIFALFMTFTFILSICGGLPVEALASNTKVIIHYQRDDKTYDDWNLWIWPDGMDGKAYDFTTEDDFGKVAVIDFSKNYENINFIVRTNDWEKDIDTDRTIKLENGFAEIWIYSGEEIFSYDTPNGFSKFDIKNLIKDSSSTGDEDNVHVRVHYHRYDNTYDGWNLWLWPENQDGNTYTFDNSDDFGSFADINIPYTDGLSQIGFIVRLNEWEAKDIDMDRFAKLSNIGNDGVLDVYLIQGDETIYYSLDDIDLTPKFLSASLTDLNKINISVSVPFELANSLDSFSLKTISGQQIPLKHVTAPIIEDRVSSATIFTNEDLSLGDSYLLSREGYGEIHISMVNIYDTKVFEKDYTYTRNDLGANYTKESTTFKLWSPTASKINLLLYKDGRNEDITDTLPMTKGENGVWEVSISKDLDGIFYNYEVHVESKINVAVDPYAKAVGVNGKKGMVVDLSKTNPDNWSQDSKPELKNFTDAIIYELHVRDLSVAENSGIKNKGKFLALTEQGTKNPSGLSTGLDHLKDLGITHLHLLPSFDYRSIDETKLEDNNFNWGYDPENYNVPEGSYSTDPYSGTSRIIEFKQAVQSLHDNDIRVVMDVVYNHTGASADSHLNKIAPGYYYRTNNGSFSNGSGCGNETASERAMVRKMIVDSVVYWAEEYHIDGFRFDLMGLHDLETMQSIRESLDAVDPSIIIYGEGWTGGTSPLPDSQKALKVNTYLLDGIAAFSDDIRDGIKGHVFTSTQPGFVNGLADMEETIKFGAVASTKHPQVDYTSVVYSDKPWANAPSQTITYASAHDNLTLWDKISVTNPNDSIEKRIKMNKLSCAIVFTSQGIPFIHAGEEMLRTKNGDENSYKSPDSINQIDWSWKKDNIDVYEYYKGLMTFRKAHPALRMMTTEEVQKNLVFFGNGEEYHNLQLAEKNVVGYLISNNANGDSAGTICVLFNANNEDKKINIPDGSWSLYINGEKAGTEVLDTIKGSEVNVKALSTMVLTRDDAIDISSITGFETSSTESPAVEAMAYTDDRTDRVYVLLLILAIAGIVLLAVYIGISRRSKTR